MISLGTKRKIGLVNIFTWDTAEAHWEMWKSALAFGHKVLSSRFESRNSGPLRIPISWGGIKPQQPVLFALKNPTAFSFWEEVLWLNATGFNFCS